MERRHTIPYSALRLCPASDPQAFMRALPHNCTQYPSNGKRAYSFRWYAGAGLPAGAKLVLDSCGLVSGSWAPLVSVHSSSAATAGPYTCRG